jgi:uncharacterized protein (TIGR02328 family)
MRLWHKDLVKILPRLQLISQWKECCCIAAVLAKDGKTNHLLINKVMNFPINHFASYTRLVINEMESRGYKVSEKSYDNFKKNIVEYIFQRYVCDDVYENMISENISFNEIYSLWHNERYLRQCYNNLEEKYDCGGITKEEFDIIKEFY